jgi:hypothetical protein
MKSVFAALLCAAALPLSAQQQPNPWSWGTKLEIRANYRNTPDEKFPLRFPFPPEFLPVGQTQGFEETVDAGHHTELSVAQLRLDLGYGKWFQAHAQLHAQDKYRRNPTSEDRKIDADELWIRFGEKPEFLERPDGTSFFAQLGKAPRMERQPVRLLESYGLAATAFNRFEDVQAIVGGTVGRNFYWRLVGANGNPLYFRDPNALAGDNGVKALLTLHPNPALKSGFPIFYNAETEDYFFNTDHFQFGQGLGYRWQNAAGSFGFDAIAFHYKRKMVFEDRLTGTFYGAELDLLDGPDGAGVGLPIHGNRKEESGARVYSEWKNLTTTVQYTTQEIAGLHRDGYELETGYRVDLGRLLLTYVQPAFRISGMRNDFRAAANKLYPSPSVWWPWTKFDYGVRVGFEHGVDVTIEQTKSNVGAPRKLKMKETLGTVRVRV